MPAPYFYREEKEGGRAIVKEGLVFQWLSPWRERKGIFLPSVGICYHHRGQDLPLLVSQIYSVEWKVKEFIAQSCPALCNPTDCCLPGSSVHGILQARILEWVAIPFSRRSSWLRDWTRVSCGSCIAGRFLTTEPPSLVPYKFLWAPGLFIVYESPWALYWTHQGLTFQFTIFQVASGSGTSSQMPGNLAMSIASRDQDWGISIEGSREKEVRNGVFPAISVNKGCHSHQRLQQSLNGELVSPRKLRKKNCCHLRNHQTAATPYGEPEETQDVRTRDTGLR